jgi:CheY-like chemotaxis protein
VVVFLAEVDRQGCQAIAQRIKRLAAEHAFLVGGKAVPLPVIAVTATYPDEALTEEELLQVTEARLRALTSRTLRILVVDDEQKARDLLKKTLEGHGYKVLTSAGGPQALAQLSTESVDLILLDLMMPGIDGYEVYHLIREDPKTKDIPVIIVTGKGERKDRELGLERPTYNYIVKPFQVEELLAKVREVLL